MRLIDADALKRTVEDFPNCYNGWSDTYDKAFIIGAIEEMPTIDAVEVVRCKDRKHWRNTDAEKIPTVSIACGNMHADDFCSYGERREP